jgi:hypothetical protein
VSTVAALVWQLRVERRYAPKKSLTFERAPLASLA